MSAQSSKRPTIWEARDVVREHVGRPLPACPVCGARFAPTGQGQPYVVGPTGEVYCRNDGESVFPGYNHKLEGYRQRQRARKALLAEMKAEGPVSEEAAAWAREQVARLDLDDAGWRR